MAVVDNDEVAVIDSVVVAEAERVELADDDWVEDAEVVLVDVAEEVIVDVTVEISHWKKDSSSTISMMLLKCAAKALHLSASGSLTQLNMQAGEYSIPGGPVPRVTANLREAAIALQALSVAPPMYILLRKLLH